MNCIFDIEFAVEDACIRRIDRIPLMLEDGDDEEFKEVVLQLVIHFRRDRRLKIEEAGAEWDVEPPCGSWRVGDPYPPNSLVVHVFETSDGRKLISCMVNLGEMLAKACVKDGQLYLIKHNVYDSADLGKAGWVATLPLLPIRVHPDGLYGPLHEHDCELGWY